MLIELLGPNNIVHPERSRDGILRRAPLAQDEPPRRSRRATASLASLSPRIHSEDPTTNPLESLKEWKKMPIIYSSSLFKYRNGYGKENSLCLFG